MKVLVVDDEYTTLTVAQKLLENEGYETVVTNNGHGLSKLITAEKPDLIVIDIFMPDSDGLENIHLVKKVSPKLPIIAISSNSKFLKVAEKFGANTSVNKPLLHNNFIMAVNQLIVTTTKQ